MSLSTHVFILTFCGEDEITNIFSTLEAAIDFAVQEIKHSSDLTEDEIVILLDKVAIGTYVDPAGVLAVITDPDETDRIYTVTNQELNPTFKP